MGAALGLSYRIGQSGTLASRLGLALDMDTCVQILDEWGSLPTWSRRLGESPRNPGRPGRGANGEVPTGEWRGAQTG